MKLATRSRHFMDAYDRGLNGRQAAWATRKYRGHRELPPDIFEELGKEGVVQTVFRSFISREATKSCLLWRTVVSLTFQGKLLKRETSQERWNR